MRPRTPEVVRITYRNGSWWITSSRVCWGGNAIQTVDRAVALVNAVSAFRSRIPYTNEWRGVHASWIQRLFDIQNNPPARAEQVFLRA